MPFVRHYTKTVGGPRSAFVLYNTNNWESAYRRLIATPSLARGLNAFSAYETLRQNKNQIYRDAITPTTLTRQMNEYINLSVGKNFQFMVNRQLERRRADDHTPYGGTAELAQRHLIQSRSANQWFEKFNRAFNVDNQLANDARSFTNEQENRLKELFLSYRARLSRLHERREERNVNVNSKIFPTHLAANRLVGHATFTIPLLSSSSFDNLSTQVNQIVDNVKSNGLRSDRFFKILGVKTMFYKRPINDNMTFDPENLLDKSAILVSKDFRDSEGLSNWLHHVFRWMEGQGQHMNEEEFFAHAADHFNHNPLTYLRVDDLYDMINQLFGNGTNNHVFVCLIDVTFESSVYRRH